MQKIDIGHAHNISTTQSLKHKLLFDEIWFCWRNLIWALHWFFAESGGRKLNENKALTSKKARYDAYAQHPDHFHSCFHTVLQIYTTCPFVVIGLIPMERLALQPVEYARVLCTSQDLTTARVVPTRKVRGSGFQSFCLFLVQSNSFGSICESTCGGWLFSSPSEQEYVPCVGRRCSTPKTTNRRLCDHHRLAGGSLRMKGRRCCWWCQF